MSSKKYLDLLKEMGELHINKNRGYAGEENPDPWANFRLSVGFGVSPLLGCLVRMSDKFIRVQNLIKNPRNEKVGENIRDTLMDLAAYALISICLLEEEKGGVTKIIDGLMDTEPFLVKPFAHSGQEWYSHFMGIEFLVTKDIDPDMYVVIDENKNRTGKLLKKKDCLRV